MSPLYRNVHELVGNTPLVELQSFSTERVKIYGKLEYFNPGGSVKDRLGMHFIQSAFEKGEINEDFTIIEATAGNTGIGLALAAQRFNLKLILCVPEKFSVEKQVLMRALGAELVLTASELGMDGAREKAQELAGKIEDSYLPSQFENFQNPVTYIKSLGPEIWEDLKGNVDLFLAGAGSGGTFTGTATYLKSKNINIRTIVVEPEGSGLNGGPLYDHLIEGIGLDKPTPFMDDTLFDAIYTISDDEAFSYVRQLALQEGLFVGSSSGAVMAAAVKERDKLEKGNIVVVFPDSSERYLSKGIYEIGVGEK